MAYQRKLFFSRERVKGASAGDSVTAGSSDQVRFFFMPSIIAFFWRTRPLRSFVGGVSSFAALKDLLRYI